MTASRDAGPVRDYRRSVNLGTAEVLILAVLGLGLIAAWMVVVAVCLVVLARRR